MDDDKIKYRDIIEPDDSLEKLAKHLDDIEKKFAELSNSIKTGADRIIRDFKGVSGATSEGRLSIEEAAEAASKLERAQKELRIAMSDTGKEIARVKSRTSEVNKSTVEYQKYTKQLETSYDRLKSDLEDHVKLYKALTAEERANRDMGQKVLGTILSLKDQIHSLNDEMKLRVETQSELEKAEQRLAYLQTDEGQKLIDTKSKIALVTKARKQQAAEAEAAQQQLDFLQSAEGQRLLDIKNKIAEVIAERRKEAKAVDKVKAAQDKLDYARSAENEAIKNLNAQTNEANRIAKLTAQLNRSKEGSYNRLAAEYELGKIQLNAMSKAEREAASGKDLEKKLYDTYQAMKKLQEATGMYKLSVGNYERAWSGLGFSINQIIREVPNAALSMHTFFVAISNNIPMVVDELERLRGENKALAAEGKPTKRAFDQVVGAIFSLNTVIVIATTLLAAYGDKIFEFINNLIDGERAADDFTDELHAVNEELAKSGHQYGDNVSKVKRLSEKWKELGSNLDRQKKFIKTNESEFNSLGVAINSVNDAQKILVDRTDDFINAMKARAKAQAALTLLSGEYQKLMIIENQIEEEKTKTYRWYENWANYFKAWYAGMPWEEDSDLSFSTRLATQRQRNVKGLEEDKAEQQKAANKMETLWNRMQDRVDEIMESLGLESPQKKEPKGKEPKDLTDTIFKNQIKAQKEYEESVTKLRSDEFAKRRKEAADEVQNENNKLREMFRKNEEYVKNVNGEYKELTEEQKKMIAQQQEWLTASVANNLERLANQLKRIEKEQQISALQIKRATVNRTDAGAETAASADETIVTTNLGVTRDASKMEASYVQERKLMEENLDLEYSLILDTNKRLLEAGDEQARSEEEILIELNTKKIELWAKYDKMILDMRAKDIEGQLALVKKGSEEELKLLLEQNELRRQAALAENAAKPAGERVSTSVIDAKFAKTGTETTGTFRLNRFDEQQALDEAVFNQTRHNETEMTKFRLEQEKARWQKQIELAKSGGLNWSQEQIATAEAMVKGADRQLSELDFVSQVGEKGLGGSLLEKLGFDDKQISALSDATNIVVEQIQSVMAAEIEAAEAAVKAAEERVAATQKAYDAEIEARNNGYANNVATAKKELEMEKRNQQQKQKQLEAAQRRQEAVNTVTQASSLITASANLWSSLSPIPIYGTALAIAAISTMWSSFALAKIRARQITAGSTEYGEGGLEFLDGGSHASGNDIDLGTTNRKGKRMRAEGGEAMAIINKRQARKYRRLLPDVVESLNKGVFEDKYASAFRLPEGMNITVNSQRSDVDLSRLEEDLRTIKKQNEKKYYVMPNGNMVMQYKNVKRVIKN